MLLQLKVVFWKNLIIRKRHWILTIVESLLPVLLFLLIAYGRSKISGLHKTEITEATYYEPTIISYDSLSIDETYLYFTPNNEFYQDIIKRTQVKFDMYNNNIKGFDSTEALLTYYSKHHNDTVIGVIFNGNDPKKLDYTIRYNDGSYDQGLDTAEMYRNKFQFSPGIGTSYSWKGILSIQKALDMSFIEKSYGKDFEDNITIAIEEFPYPPYKIDTGVTTIFIIYLPLITIFSFIFLCPAVLKHVVEEKYTGIKELMKMMGMKSWMLWLGWFIHGMIPMLFSIVCIIILMKVPVFGTKYPPIEYSDGSVLFVFLLLYCMAAVVFCFAISSFFKKPTLAMITGILIWILSYFVPKYSLGLEESTNRISWPLGMLLNLLPNMALHFGYAAVSSYEEREIGIQWYNIHKGSSGGADDVTMLNVFIMLLVDVLFYMSLTLYMDQINPGKYGVRKSIFFPIHMLMKLLRKIIGQEYSESDGESARLEYIEKGDGMKKGIEIQNLSKRYGHKLAVDNFSLDIYQNQITVLLGHNGAGKSTTMSMITGMIGITEGCVKMNGKNIKHNMDEIRKNLGLCPQHNLLFTDLTVGEHLQFFARLKGKTPIEAERETKSILEKLNMLEKKNSMVDTLSGGMKRKLCLGMAVIGGSNILILDEPTSGMDPESRRELWDLLLSWRGEKTILITTHFMEEADALGDWIAIMANGTLQCYGTPMFLKRKYDTGYHLSLMVNGDATETEKSAIKETIVKRINKSQLNSRSGNNLVFVLPFENNKEMVNLFSDLEDHKDDLKIENISVTVTTLEDVFLKAKMDSKYGTEESKPLDLDEKESLTESKLYLLRASALLTKKCQFYKKKVIMYLAPATVASIFFLLTFYLSRNSNGYYRDNGPHLKFTLDVYKQTTVFYNGTETDFTGNMKTSYKQLVEDFRGIAVDVKDVLQAIVDKGIENIVYYKEHVIASAEFHSMDSKIHATALFNAIAVHSSPISLNLVTNALAKALLGAEYSISASSWPLETIISNATPQTYSETSVAVLWLIMMPLGSLFIVGSFILFPHIELSTKFTQMQYMCGVKPYFYWTLNFIADFLLYIIVITIMAIMMIFTPFIGAQEFCVLLVLLFMYGLACIPFAYIFSRKSTASGAFSLFIITCIFFGIILTVVNGVLLESGDDKYINIGKGLKIFFMIVFPQYALTHSGLDFCRKAINNYNMEVMSRMKYRANCDSNPNPCCLGNTTECEQYKSYWPLLENNFLYMFISFVMFLSINIFWDCYIVKKYISKFSYKIRSLTDFYKSSEKKIKVDKIGDSQDIKTSETLSVVVESNPQNPNQEVAKLNAKNLHKTYSGKPIVRNVNVTLKDGECIGILGVNGAGKTTTFRMLTREEVVDEGSIEITDGKKKIDINDNEYLEQLGYCPQIDTLNFVLTGRQILQLIANLRGVQDPTIVEKFLDIFELRQYEDIPCGHYSGGNKRKLSLAVAMIGYPKYVLLDEPTNGVDPCSRRKFWELIKGVQKIKHLSFILTSHSMVECEALCNNLKIMKNGIIEKEGTISALKKDFGGYTIKLKLNRNESYDETDSTPLLEKDDILYFNTIEKLSQYFEKTYGAEIKDKHPGLLHFCIKDKNQRWSKIFKDVETIKSVNSHLVEDYAISEASLEDIFLSVARSEESNTDQNEGKKRKSRSRISTI